MTLDKGSNLSNPVSENYYAYGYSEFVQRRTIKKKENWKVPSNMWKNI